MSAAVLAATKKVGLLLKGTARYGDYEKLQLAVVGLIRQVCSASRGILSGLALDDSEPRGCCGCSGGAPG